MGTDIDRRSSQRPARRQGGVRPFHVLGTAVVAVVGVVVAFWALSFVAGLVWGVVKAAVVVAVIVGVVWLFARRRR